jgi:hypothetical protein
MAAERGYPPGLGGFGAVGDAPQCYAELIKVISRVEEIAVHVETDSVNVEKYVKEVALMAGKLGRVVGRMFEEEHLRFISMYTAAGSSTGAVGRQVRSIMENRVIMNLKAVTGDKSWFRQWHQKFVAAIGQVRREYEEIVLRLVKEIDLGNELDRIIVMMRGSMEQCSRRRQETSGTF